jgi:hypothetical protein
LLDSLFSSFENPKFGEVQPSAKTLTDRSIIPHRARQEQRQQFCPAFAVDNPVNHSRPKSPLEGADGSERVCNIIAEECLSISLQLEAFA